MGFEMRAEIFQEGIGLLVLGGFLPLRGLGARTCDGGRHGRLFDVAASATRTGHGARADLLLVGSARAEPGIEIMPPIADECVTNHEASLRAGSGKGPATSKSNSRPCLRFGIRARASAEAARSRSAKITPGSSPPSARTSPQGETIRLWP